MELLSFWSYVHADDEIEMGRITQLAADIVGHYEALRAESLELFLDRDDLHWGDNWRERIDAALSNVAFFIPVITPRYFTRVECRREFQFFQSRAEALGIEKLILPILYIDVPELHEAEPSDPLMKAIKEIQWESWEPYRFADRESGEYRRAVHKLAQELVDRVTAVERVDVIATVTAADSDGDLESGTLDKLAALEEAMPRWAATLEDMAQEIGVIGALMESGTAAVEKGDAQGKGFAARLTVARRLAGDLEEPVSKMETLGQAFAGDLSAIDSGVRVLLTDGAEQVQHSQDPQEREAFCVFAEGLRELSASTVEGLAAVQGMVEAISPMEQMSKDMRPPLRRLRTTLTAMLQARETTSEWLEILAAADVDCGGVATNSDDL